MSSPRTSQLLFALALAALAVCVLLDPKGHRLGARLAEKVRTLRSGNGQLLTENLRLAREVVGLKADPIFLERAIREELGYAHPGELILELDETSSRVAGLGLSR